MKARGGSYFEGYILVTETNNPGEVADLSFCQDVRAQENVQLPMLFDVNGEFASMMQISSPRHWHFVFAEGNVIDFRRQNAAGDQGFEPAVNALLP